MQNTPNILSLYRIAAGPLVYLLIAQDTTTFYVIALVAMLTAEASDLADGYIARKLDATSDVGKIIDPLADSVYRSTVFLAFVDAGWMMAWMVAFIFSRDIIVSYLRIFAQQEGLTMAARPSGKIKAIVQGVAQFAAVLIVSVNINFSIIYYLMLFVVIVTIWSAIDYFNFFRSNVLIKQ